MWVIDPFIEMDFLLVSSKDEYASYFEGLSEQELEELAASFKFENCVQRDELTKILSEDARTWCEMWEVECKSDSDHD
jgi:hypothetical protein